MTIRSKRLTHALPSSVLGPRSSVLKPGGRVRGPRTEDRGLASSYPPINLLLRIDLFVVVGDGREADGFLLPQAEASAHLHRVEKELLHAVLQHIVEVDQHVPAQDDVEVIERGVRDEVVLREDRV